MKQITGAILLALCFVGVLPAEEPFFPVSVWYAGGKARAPMLEPVTAHSRQAWREDLLKIKELNFNTVRTWVEWSAAEPRPEEFRFEPLEIPPRSVRVYRIDFPASR